jgi:hypothetical protein
MVQSPLEVLLEVVAILDREGIPYMVGGSFASSIHGMPRMTQDADLVVDLNSSQLASFVSSVESDYYIDREAAFEALANRSSFNIIHLESMFKVDLFVLRNRAFDQDSFSRRRFLTIGDKGAAKVAICAPEEMVVTKLEWYESGNRVSDRQYRDVLGMIMVQTRAGQFDRAHAEQLARELGLVELLAQALDDADSRADD